MPTKEDNLINYENSSVMKKALHFKDKKYLLIHGTADGKLFFIYTCSLKVNSFIVH